MSRFLSDLLEFDGLALEVCSFAPELALKFRDFGPRLFECLVPLTCIAQRGLELCRELPSLFAKNLGLFG